MGLIVEFLVQQRPHSAQANSRKGRSNVQRWRDIVAQEARNAWLHEVPRTTGDYQVTILYMAEGIAKGNEPDADNIIKPIQDALKGVVLVDDRLVTDVDSHRRVLKDSIELTNLPGLVLLGLSSGSEFVYVRVSTALALEDYL